MPRLSIFIACFLSFSGQARTLMSARELISYTSSPTNVPMSFALTGRVNGASQRHHSILLEDETGIVQVFNFRQNSPSVGDIVILRGVITDTNNDLDPSFKDVTAETIGRTNPPVACKVQLSELNPRDYFNRLVTTEGVVTDFFHDDIDDLYDFLLLQGNGVTLPVLTRSDSIPDPSALLGATVRITCIYRHHVSGWRRYLGAFLELAHDTAPEIIQRATPPFSEPRLETVPYTSADKILQLGRRCVSGTVIATWDRNRILLMINPKNFAEVTLAKSVSLPDIGDRITISGYAETDSFTVKFGRAIYRLDARNDPKPMPVKPVSISQLVSRTRSGARYGYTLFQYRRIQIRGLVRAAMTDASGRRILTLESDGFLFPVELSAPHQDLDIPMESEIEATGICVFNIDRWSPLQILPRIRGFTLVPQYRNDLRVLTRPPWWTRQRLGAVILMLLGALVAVYVWNRSLARLAVRRGHELIRAEFAASRSELRTGERTRLAIELHDALSQTLTGVACQISAARSALRAQSPSIAVHLETADKMLLSCRSELRRCLWDLRNNALEERDFSSALRMTISPAIGNAELVIRFNVLRSQLDDSVAHAVLCIIRELCTNAVRHGNASRLLVVGELHDGHLSFSVRDNGSGFDPAAASTPEEGHFGLSGIRERLHALHGNLMFAHATEGGMQVTVEFPVQELSS